ncbi:uncharacterized protein LOC119546365 [Drosophila subpulchrella]|uniref:uncharacterized protein LOC119546365 n=1 Tax=Drosophila subpulchrella TaxID=1486046 RepID=UPI0018A13FD4|nr:uncharacterized protein LOC119546365 [Drosophila subpulchrella]
MFKLCALQKQTRKRGKNFAPSEEIKLLELLEPFRHIIDNKNSDATCQLKKETWEKLEYQFFNQTVSKRTWRTLKDEYKNMNSKPKTAGAMTPCYPQTEELDPISSCVSEPFQEIPEDNPPEPEPQFVNKKLPRRFIISKRKKKRLLDDEHIALIRLQQRFYYNENIRSGEKHRLELRSINLKNELMELELEEKRRRLRIDD